MIESIRIDLAASITAISLVITAIATFLVAIRDKKSSGKSEEKAISVTRINDTDKKVETLREQVDFLFDEIGKLRAEKDELVKEVARLRVELKNEKSDHTETKRRLEAALAELRDKTARLEALESVSKTKEL